MTEQLNEWLLMIDDCEKRQDQLTEWELHFIDSLSIWLDKHEGLTSKQDEKLTAIWERVTA